MKLLILLKALHKEEFREFEKFLQSPFFKASDQYLAFFRYLYKHYPAFELERDELEISYRNCFGANSFTETKLYNLMSGMAKQVEQYLAIQLVLTQDERNGISLQQFLLVRSLGERNMSVYYRTEAEQLIAQTESLPAKSSDDYLSLYLLNRDYYFNPDTPKHLTHQPYLQAATENLIIHHGISFLRFVAELKARGHTLNSQQDLSMLEAVLTYTNDAAIREKHPLAAVYNSLVKLYQQGVSEHGFRKIKELLVGNFEQLPKQEQRLLLAHAINIGISLNASEANVYEELLSLYKLAIGVNALLEGNRITHIAFFNIAAAAAHCKDFDWAMGFVTDFSRFLEVDKELCTVNLSKAFINYEQGNLLEAHACLDTDVFRVTGFELSGRLLHLKIIFDKYLANSNEFQFLSHTLSALEKYIVDKKSIAPDKRESLLHFIRFVRLLAKEKTENARLSAKIKTGLSQKLNNHENIIFRDWLDNRISRL